MGSLPFLLISCSIFVSPLSGLFLFFLHFLMFHFSIYLCWVNFHARNFLGFSGVASFIALCGCSRFALSSVCVGSLVVLGLLLFGGSFVGGFSPPVGILMLAAPTYFLCVAGGFLPPTLSDLCLIARVVITEGLERLWQGQGQQLLQLPLAEAWCFLLHPLALVSSLL